jgi:hypothetical protein
VLAAPEPFYRAEDRRRGALHAVRWLPFMVRRIDSNTHTGTLLANYELNDPLLPWTYAGTNASGITSVRLVHSYE